MHAVSLLALSIALLALAGCVSRKLFLVTTPPGARVMLDGRVVGTTPYQEEFRSYGTRRVEFILEGYEPLVGQICLEQPWWQYPPFDLFTDILLPFTFRSEFTFDWNLSPRGDAATLEDAKAAYERMQKSVENLPRDNP